MCPKKNFEKYYRTIARLRSIGLASVACMTLASCSSVEFYKDQALTQKTGLKFYSSKPYLLVTRTGAKDKPIDVAIQYLPNADDPTYAKFIPGLGSHKFEVALNNGMLASYGQEGDTKTAETLTAIAGIMTARAQIISAKAEEKEADVNMSGITPASCPDKPELLKTWGMRLKDIASGLETVINNADSRHFTLARVIDDAKKLEVDLSTEGDKLVAMAAKDPKTWPKCEEITTEVMALSDRLSALRFDAPNSEPGQLVTNNFETLKLSLLDLIEEISPPPEIGVEAYELYEIVIRNGRTRLIPVRTLPPVAK